MLKKILGLTIVSVILLTLTVGGTWAYMSDTGKSTQRPIKAGKLYLLTSNDDGETITSGVTQTITSLKFKPGQTKTSTITLFNDAGNLNASHLDISFSYTKVNGDQNGTVVMNADSTASILRITVLQRDRDPIGGYGVDLMPYIHNYGNAWIDVYDLATGTDGSDSSHMQLSDLPGLNNGDPTTITIGIQMITYADLNKASLDAFQGDGIDLTMKFTLKQ